MQAPNTDCTFTRDVMSCWPTWKNMHPIKDDNVVVRPKRALRADLLRRKPRISRPNNILICVSSRGPGSSSNLLWSSNKCVLPWLKCKASPKFRGSGAKKPCRSNVFISTDCVTCMIRSAGLWLGGFGCPRAAKNAGTSAVGPWYMTRPWLSKIKWSMELKISEDGWWIVNKIEDPALAICFSTSKSCIAENESKPLVGSSRLFVCPEKRTRWVSNLCRAFRWCKSQNFLSPLTKLQLA